MITVALVGLNLRPFMTSIGPVVNRIKADMGLGLQGIALLTLVPMLLMGVIALLGPWIHNTLGERKASLIALSLICIGCASRFIAPNGLLLIGTAGAIGLGVAMLQVTFPSLIKREFADQMGPMMGLYSAMLMGGGALGAFLTPLITAQYGSWQFGLAIFSVPALVALLLAARYLAQPSQHKLQSASISLFLSQPRTWLLIVCFGLINSGYTSIVAWLAPAYQELGWSAKSSGNLMAILTLCQAISALVLPYLARKNQDRRLWLSAALVMQIVGFAGLVFIPQMFAYVWVMLIGAGLGGCFALMMIIVLDHLPDPVMAGQLSALMQGGGFLIAAIAPWWVAILHDITASYTTAWMLQLFMVIVVTTLVYKFNPRHYADVIDVEGER